MLEISGPLLGKISIRRYSQILSSFFNIRNEYCAVLLQPTVFAAGIGPEDPFGKLHGGGAVVEVIPAAVGIAKVHMRSEQHMVFFPVGSLLDKGFAEEIRSLTGGYLHRKRLMIRPEKIRGEVSEGLLLPIEVLSRYTVIEELCDGDSFTELNGREICSIPIPERMDIDPINNTLLKFHEVGNCPETVFIPCGIRKIGRSSFMRCKKTREGHYSPNCGEYRRLCFFRMYRLQKCGDSGQR